MGRTRQPAHEERRPYRYASEIREKRRGIFALLLYYRYDRTKFFGIGGGAFSEGVPLPELLFSLVSFVRSFVRSCMIPMSWAPALFFL